MNLIPYATHAKAEVLIVGVAVYIGNAEVQPAGPSAARIALYTTPPVAADTNTAVRSIVVTITARKACET